MKARRGLLVFYVGQMKKASLILTVVVIVFVVVVVFLGRHPIFR